MTGTAHEPAARPAAVRDDVLAELLLGAVDRGRRTVAVRSLRRLPFPRTTSFALELVTAELSDGSVIEAVLKNFAFSRLPKPGLAGRRRREPFVYARLLSGTALGTARCYGAASGEDGGTGWLLLELVGGQELRWCGAASWEAAAAWLSRLHGAFADRADAIAEAPLVVHDRDFFLAEADLALHAVGAVSAPFGARLERLLAGYERLAEDMAAGARTLVHGSYRPQNIIVGPGDARICPVDWELAARGSIFYDLAFLADGWTGEGLRSLLDAYEDTALSQGVTVPAREDLVAMVERLRLHKLVSSLGHCRRWPDPMATAANVLDSAERVRRDIS